MISSFNAAPDLPPKAKDHIMSFDKVLLFLACMSYQLYEYDNSLY